MLASSMLIYSFRCICDAFYVGRTTRQLSTRIREHLPRWLRHGGKGLISSTVLAHLVDTGHQVDPQKAFGVVLKIPPNRSKAVRLRMLATAEAISIRRLTPNLCVQKRFVQTLQLPWPPIDPTHSWVDRCSHFVYALPSDLRFIDFCHLSFKLSHIICSGPMMNYRKQLFATTLLF